MKSTRRPARCPFALLSIAIIVFLLPSPVTGQHALYLDGYFPGSTGSSARGIAERGWEPLTLVGTVETTHSNASCWIRVSNVWSVHVLPGLALNAESRANAVDHVPWDQGEWTLVVGAAVDASGALRPVRWLDTPATPWTVDPLLTLNGGNGEAHTLFLPDGMPVRALIGGWADVAPPTAAPAANIRVPVIWEATPTGERIMQPEYGAGLPAHVKDIASSGPGVFAAAGSGENAAGQWRPQWWTSMDNGSTWSNEEMPLPLGVASGEAVDCDHEVGHWFAAGWGQLTSGRTVPLVWDLDTSVPTWIIHQLPLPGSDEGGQNSYTHKVPGARKYANIVLKGEPRFPVVGLWFASVDSLAGGWTLFEPEDYLLNPEVGTPVAPAGIDKYGRVAVTFVPPPPTGGSGVTAQTATKAGVLIPSPATAIDDARSTPPWIAMSGSPNPFRAGIRIGYILPRAARVRVTVHDVAGRVVSRLDQGQVPAGEERVVHWNGREGGGERAASGVYFVRVETPYEISTLKIVRLD